MIYINLSSVISSKKVTYTQIADLLQCQIRTVSGKIDGTVKSGFTLHEACMIKKVLFPEYDILYLFDTDEEDTKVS